MTDRDSKTARTAQEADTWELMLFVARDDERTRILNARLERMLKEHLSSPYRIETVNIFTDVKKGYQFDVIITPTLIRVKPEPQIRLVGDLTLTEKVLVTLGLDSFDGSG